MSKQDIEKMYPVGTRIKLIYMDPPEKHLPPGSIGTVRYIDDASQIHMRWDCGSSLALIPGNDEFEKIS